MAHQIQLLDVVALLSDRQDLGLVRGQMGTVVEVYEPEVFEVEFNDVHGTPYASKVLSASELMLLRHEPIVQSSSTSIDKTSHPSNSFIELMHKIQKRPSMYLGKPSISSLSSFLAGYTLARRELDIPSTPEEENFSKFQAWIQKKFRISTGQSWEQIILFYSEDENSALNKFFKLFEEFLNSSSVLTPGLKGVPVGVPSIRKPNLDTRGEPNVPNENTNFQSTTNG